MRKRSLALSSAVLVVAVATTTAAITLHPGADPGAAPERPSSAVVVPPVTSEAPASGAELWPVAGKTLRVGFNGEIPGWSYPDINPKGFDVDLANYLAGRLGFTVVPVALTPYDREGALLRGEVDLVIANYSMDGASTTDPAKRRKDFVDFAGPYFVDRSGQMVDLGKLAAITHQATVLDSEHTCVTKGTTAADKIGARAKDTLRECLDPFLNPDDRQFDAVETDEAILLAVANFRKAKVDPAYWESGGLVNPKEFYGVAMRKVDSRACNEFTTKIHDFVNSQAWETSYDALHIKTTIPHKPEDTDHAYC
ncbi:transporter substrate-binding domain-containing protein [Amycolatopsis sp., V23-08]|uniref:Transporter substrate-binding domain-containing protein n=1 Tax=Amycolatopsis heterodermiae TaxID=3110235 RepID=A0ABU5R928_9PSEU|nr:transporter substrate-binding domain-containing protein [Amycolatopsis sp., V23-08]MEA5362753.1 transporter substrate-binding domain-containing protein [Amycolatopsis sp., V23-08]